MAGRYIIMVTTEELKKVSVINQVIKKQLTQVDAADILNLSDRQIRRIAIKIKAEGEQGVAHKSRGKPCNRTKPDKLKKQVLTLCKIRYKDFNPTFASEKLFEESKLSIHPETLRLWFIDAGIPYKKRKKRKYRSWRPRKLHAGEMVQIDGSEHDWFEGRGPECVLMGYIDDARGRFFGRFYAYEGTKPAMDSFKRYIKKYGIPQSAYFDKHSTYKSPKKPTIEEELKNIKAQSQLQRALGEIGVNVIHAHSAPAKGRIERSFETHQDRLIKEMRLKDIKSIEEANKFLESYYIPKHNRKFTVIAKEKADLHMSIPKGLDLDTIFCKKKKAFLRNDFTVAYNKKLYQIMERVSGKNIEVQERLNGRVFMVYKGRNLKHKEITERPVRKTPTKPYVFKIKKVWRPPMNHPYKASLFGRRYPHIHNCPQKEKVAKRKRLLLTKT